MLDEQRVFDEQHAAPPFDEQHADPLANFVENDFQLFGGQRPDPKQVEERDVDVQDLGHDCDDEKQLKIMEVAVRDELEDLLMQKDQLEAAVGEFLATDEERKAMWNEHKAAVLARYKGDESMLKKKFKKGWKDIRYLK